MFATLNAAVADLRTSLRSFVSEDALSEITVRPPAGDGDEASFLRLVVWSYALTFEAGRVAIPYLLELPGGTSDSKSARDLIHTLRTWSFHNLGFDNKRDVATSRHAQLWFVKTCGSYPPTGTENWQKCFLALCTEVETIVTHCQGAMTNVLSAPDDGESATEDLRRRIDRAWPAYKFHKITSDAVFRLGGIVDTQKFCAPRLSKWREFLESLPEESDLENYIKRVIEKDLLNYTEEMLPINGDDIMDKLEIPPGPEIGAALRQARELFRSGIRDPEHLLEHLSALWATCNRHNAG